MRTRWLLWLFLLSVSTNSFALDLKGEPIQGGLMFGHIAVGGQISLDGQNIPIADDGHFVIGFGRDETGTRQLLVQHADGQTEEVALEIASRSYDIERVDGLPPATVTPAPEALERIRAETRMVVNARARRGQRADYAAGFQWPAQGRISGQYGSQRVLNGKPARPHFGVDVAAPEGTLVRAPAAGVITLAHPDMYFSGGTVILDHGQGLSSTMMHLSAVLVEAGVSVQQGDPIGRIGSTGRATGPHLDWRMNWLDRRVDPQRLVTDMSTLVTPTTTNQR